MNTVIKVCKVDECSVKRFGKGYCNKHYYRFTTYGDPLILSRAAPGTYKVCIVEACNNTGRIAKGYCSMHYQRFNKYGDETTLLISPKVFHGMSGTSEYITLCDAKQRCNNPNHKGYKNYGGRGIKFCVCLNDPRNLIKAIGYRPKGLSLDRIDNDGNYCVCNLNLKWSTRKQQAKNTRNPIAKHGTISMYGHHKCRCGLCRKAASIYGKEYYHANK